MSIIIDNIPADVEVEMTPNLIRAFFTCGCDPACHNCGVKLMAGMVFKLAYVKKMEYYFDYSLGMAKETSNEEQDEMLCEKCTPLDLYETRKKQWQKKDDWQHRKGYTRQHL